MKKNILQVLEETTAKYPDKLAFADIKKEVTYQEFTNEAKQIGSALLSLQATNEPIGIYIDKNVQCLDAMMGVLYSGNFYTILDTASPQERIQNILTTLQPIAIVTDKKNLEKAKQLQNVQTIYIYEEIIQETIKEQELMQIRSKMIDTDPMYILFTSGSTGMPKGTVICHHSVIAYSSWITKTFAIDENTIFGSQTPFYFSMSVSDIFATICAGASFYIIPKMYFSFPVKLLQYLNEKKINTIYWVPSALCIVANLKALDEVELPYLKKVLFAGEVMPTKQLNTWIQHLPNAMFANLFGPTETTDICTYYVVDRKFEDSESLPIGKSCDNCDVLIITEEGKQAQKGEKGELCVRGAFLASGYYNNQVQTEKAFVQNPLNTRYPEIIYKTGDIVQESERGEIIYLSRKDFQIKHMGYRIELGEIETAINAIDGIILCACVYDNENSKIVLFYQGDKLDKKDLLEQAKKRLPNYMCPNEIICLDRMPYNANGKVDRKKLKDMIKES